MSAHIVLKNNLIKLKRKRIIIRLIISFFVVLFIFIGIVIISNNKYVRISNIYIEGNSVVLSKNIKTEINKVLSGKYLWLFPRNDIFIYPKQQIKKDILDTFSRIYDVKINMVDTNSIKIILKERVPFALWCGDAIYSGGRKISDRCYFLDKSGFIFTQSPNFSDNVYFEFYGVVDSGIIGKQFLTKEEFSKVIAFKNLLDNSDIKVDRFLVNKKGDYVFYVNDLNKTSIFFNKSQNFEKIFYDLKSAINKKTAEIGGKDIFKNLNYVDLRFKDKILFKF